MGFTIGTALSFGYRPVLDFCLPSWVRNSGADRIEIKMYSEPEAEHFSQRYLKNLITRCELFRGFIRDAIARKTKLLLLDADCLVLQDVSGGFSPTKPFALTRWPNINMGVMFLNTELPWPFVEFFDTFIERATKRCEHAAERGPNAFLSDNDQPVMIDMLSKHDSDVEKLPAKTWNFTYSDPWTKERLAKYRDTIKILHLRIATSLNRQLERFAFLRDIFPGRI